MNVTEKITKWVERKVGKLIDDEVNDKIRTESSTIDVEECAEKLLNSVRLNGEDLKELKNELFNEADYHLDFDTDDSKSDVTSQDSLDCEHYDFQTPSLEEIVTNLQSDSEEVQVNALEILEASPAEELVIQTSWTLARKILQDMLRTNYSNNKIPLLVLKVSKFISAKKNVHKYIKIFVEGISKIFTFPRRSEDNLRGFYHIS